MSMFEYNDYDHDRDYQNYLDWKEEQEQLEREEETTGERCVREAQQEEEEEVRQLAQVTVSGVYRYELEWLPETHEVRVEIDHYRDGSPIHCWYPDTMGTMEVLSKIMCLPGEKIRITDLKFFTPERVIDDLFESERRQFLVNTWRDYAEDGMAMQFNVEIACPNDCYDVACDGKSCEFKRPHGIDGTQCDCSDCTLDYGLCSCGCAGNHQAHAEWLEEREKELESFVHETVNPPPEAEEEEEEEGDDESETSVESAEEKENRMWSDFKLAMSASFLALILGMYICRTLGC